MSGKNFSCIKRVVVCFLTAIPPAVFAQELKTNTKTDTVITTKISVFNYFDTPETDKIRNAFKINPLLLANGDLPFYWEHKINEKLSIELALGITFRDYIYDIFHIPEDIIGLNYANI